MGTQRFPLVPGTIPGTKNGMQKAGYCAGETFGEAAGETFGETFWSEKFLAGETVGRSWLYQGFRGSAFSQAQRTMPGSKTADWSGAWPYISAL